MMTARYRLADSPLLLEYKAERDRACKLEVSLCQAHVNLPCKVYWCSVYGWFGVFDAYCGCMALIMTIFLLK